ncbi:MAG: hypothetical protein V3T17_13640 [Pseudomonadales bacterium]
MNTPSETGNCARPLPLSSILAATKNIGAAIFCLTFCHSSLAVTGWAHHSAYGATSSKLIRFLTLISTATTPSDKEVALYLHISSIEEYYSAHTGKVLGCFVLHLYYLGKYQHKEYLCTLKIRP